MDIKDFFKQPIVIIAIIIVIILLSLMLFSYLSSGDMTFFQQAIGTVFSPLQKGATSVKNFVADKWSYFSKYDDLKAENELLNIELRAKDNDSEKLKELERENAELKEYLGLKDEHPDYELVYAQVVAREPGNFYGIFTIDRGYNSDIAVNDIVVTPEGVVGTVVEVGKDFSKVSTIIETGTAIGSIITRSRDVAILEGDADLRDDGKCKLTLMQSKYSAQEGDVIQTSGIGGTFPKGLILGTVTKVYKDPLDGVSYIAEVNPAADLTTISGVIVITNFTKDGGE